MYFVEWKYSKSRVILWFEDAKNVAEYLEEHIDFTDEFDEMLDESYESVEICGAHYCVSHILHECDPIAYRCYLSDYTDSRREDMLYEIERMENGDKLSFYDYTVDFIHSEDEDDEE